MIINYQPFSMESTVFMNDGSQISVSSKLNSMADTIVNLAYAKNDYRVLIAQNMVNEFSAYVAQKECQEYSENKIVIEGIE